MNSLIYSPAHSMTSLVPKFIKDTGFREPADNLYFLEARRGTYLVKHTALFSASVRVAGMPSCRLLDHKERIESRFGRIPRGVLSRVFGFFRMMLVRPGGEGIVILYYSLATRKFRVKVPSQNAFCRCNNLTGDVDELHVCYGRMVRPTGFVKLGTIHSHGRFPAFHSRIDDADEMHGEDGLHITMGCVHRKCPTLSVSFVVNGKRFMLNAKDVLDGKKELVPLRPPASWLQEIPATPCNKQSRKIQRGNRK